MLRLVMKHAVFVEVLPLNPRFAFKFASTDYLARNLSIAERKSCFIHHYTRLRDAFPDAMLRRILHRHISILGMQVDGSMYQVTAHLSRPFDKEGELALVLELDGVEIYFLFFSIVPGRIVRSAAPEVLLISLLQGAKGKYDLIQRATKAMNDVDPRFLLLAVLQGFAEALGVSEIAGVSATRQSAYKEEHGRMFRGAYDSFFLQLGAVLGPEQLYHCPVPIPEKPLTEVKRGHKLRTKEKRAFKRAIAEAVRRFFQQNLRTSNDGSRLEQTFEVPVQLEL